MSTGPLGALGGAAGSPFAQRAGADVDRAATDRADSERKIDSAERAESAAGVGETDGEDNFTNERDADGRQLWDRPPEESAAEESPAAEPPPPSKPATDPDGLRGGQLDLSG